MPSHFEEDSAVNAVSARFGLRMERRRALIVTDLKALELAGLTKKAPDYARIRRLLDDGSPVEGASLGGVEYTFRRTTNE